MFLKTKQSYGRYNMVRAGRRTQGDCAYYAGRHARATSGGSHYLQAARTPGRCHPARSAMPRSADKPPAQPGKRRLLRARREVAVWNQIQEEGGCARVHDCTLGAAARTVVQRPTCAATTARRALAGVAALSATAKCAGRPPSRRAPAMRDAASVCQCRLKRLSLRSA